MEIRFVLRLNLRDKNKLATIYCRLTVDGQRAGDFSTFEHVLPHFWHAKGQVVTCGTQEGRLTNEALTNIGNSLKEIYNRLVREGQPVTAQGIKAGYLQKNTATRTFLDLFKLMIERKQVEKKASGTLRQNRSKYHNLKKFLVATNQVHLLPAEFNERVADQLTYWLRENLCCGKDHLMKHLQLVKQVLKLAVRLGDIAQSPLQYLSLERDKPRAPVALTRAQLQKLETFVFSSAPLQRVADLFVFGCYTGFHYGDIVSFDPAKHLYIGQDGQIWIDKARDKTGERAILPFFEGARRIFEKYEGKLPVRTNQPENRFLKEIATIIGIGPILTTKIARKTAATLWLNDGYSEESVARMLGHTNTRQLKVYAHVQERKIAAETRRMTGEKAH